jgi:hypothetical protein
MKRQKIDQLQSDGDVEGLIAALTDNDAEVREAAAMALYFIGDSSAVSHLIAALRDENWFVRVAAIQSLGNIGDTQALKPITAALNDENNYVVQNARAALRKLGMEEKFIIEHTTDRTTTEISEYTTARTRIRNRIKANYSFHQISVIGEFLLNIWRGFVYFLPFLLKSLVLQAIAIPLGYLTWLTFSRSEVPSRDHITFINFIPIEPLFDFIVPLFFFTITVTAAYLGFSYLWLGIKEAFDFWGTNILRRRKRGGRRR